ncbi:MAG: protein phosphatase 2C domain-containing protein [Halioglobus sp.]
MSALAAGSPVRAFGFTAVGQRDHNEDALLVNQDIGLMVVADGVGGHQAGEVASELTCQVLAREIAEGSSLPEAIKVANRDVFDAVAQSLGREGMASTVVAVHFKGTAWELAWVGDSRAYLWDGQLGLLSRDHSLVEGLVQSGQISLEEARYHPKKNVIDQAVGLQGEDNLRVGSNAGVLQPGQVLLLCSDGLNDVLDSAQIAEILASEGTLEEHSQQLVSAAVAAGGRDNTTVILLDVDANATAGAGVREPSFVWRYDPESNSYAGHPKLKAWANVPPVAAEVADGTLMRKLPEFDRSVSPTQRIVETLAGRPYLLLGLGVLGLVLLSWLGFML